jgi:hypothetical protein
MRTLATECPKTGNKAKSLMTAKDSKFSRIEMQSSKSKALELSKVSHKVVTNSYEKMQQEIKEKNKEIEVLILW